MVMILTMTLALAVGYVSVIVTYFLLSFALTTSAPNFVSEAGRFRSAYLLLNYLLWLLCTFLGAFAVTFISAAWFPWLPVTLLGIALILLTWQHPLEAHRQLAGLARPLMCCVSFVGVALGYFLRLKR